MIVVIGGTGNTGRALVAALSAKGLDFKCLVRDVDKARETLGADVALVQGDLDDPASLDHAFEGADKVFLNSGHGPALKQQQLNAIEAAKRAGISQFVKMSGSEKGVTADGPSQIMRDHYQVEQALKASAPEALELQEADDVLPFDEVEKRAILDALRKCDGDISKAARKLGLSRATIYRKLEKYGER